MIENQRCDRWQAAARLLLTLALIGLLGSCGARSSAHTPLAIPSRSEPLGSLAGTHRATADGAARSSGAQIPGGSPLSVSPQRAALVAGQTLSLTAADDPRSVTWSVRPHAGSLAPASSAGRASVTFTAPRTAGVYTIRATSVTNPSLSGSATVAVTDLRGVDTYHDDLARDGVNDEEYALTPRNVNDSDFGKLFSCPVDGAIYAQPLWVPHIMIDGAWHNVVFVATEHDSLYAFDADRSPCERFWKADLIDRHHGGLGGETTVPSSGRHHLVGKGDGDLTPEVGVTGTPVIDPATGTLYVVSASVAYSAGLHFYERLHAIDLATGAEKPGSPVTIRATYRKDGGGIIAFDSRTGNQRAGLALANGTVYVAFGSHEDQTPFYGWIIGYRYDGSGFTRTCVLNIDPNSDDGGVWMGGAAPAVGAGGRLYVVTGNGGFDAASADPPDDDYGDSLLELSGSLRVLQYFTPSDQQFDNVQNNDFGSGGVVLAEFPPGSPLTRAAIAGGKDGQLFVLDRAHLGGYGNARAWEDVDTGIEKDVSGAYPGVLFTEGAYWDGRYYLAGAGVPLKEYRLDPADGKLSFERATSEPRGGFGYPGATPAVSALGDRHGIVWVLDDRAYCTPGSQGCGPAILHAYDAVTLKELWNSAQVPGNAAGNAVKFTVPTIADGRVYIGTRGNNTGGVHGSTSISGELDVYGLEAN